MGRLENETFLTCHLRGQSTLMTKCVAEQILGKWLELISIYLEIYSLDVEVITKAEVNELKHLSIVPLKGSKKSN